MRRKQGREVVYVRAGGRLLRQVAVLGRRARRGAGAAVRAAQRRGDPPRAAAPAVEAAGDDRGEARRAGPAVRRRRASRSATWTTRTSTTRSSSSRGMPRRPGRGAAPSARGGAGAPPGRGAGPAPRRGRRSRSRSPERVRPGGWYRSPAGFIRRTLQAADENNLPFLASALTFDALLAAIPFVLLLLIGLTHLAQAARRAAPPVDPTALFHRFFPPHISTPGRDPVRASVETLLVRISQNRGHDLALRRSGVRLVQHPALRRRSAPR